MWRHHTSLLFQEYPDKARCFECGEFGHLSYKCSYNILGERRRPRKKKKKRKEKEEEPDDYYNPDITLAEAIDEDAATYLKTEEIETEVKVNSEETDVKEEPDVHVYEDPDGNLFKTSASDNSSGKFVTSSSRARDVIFIITWRHHQILIHPIPQVNLCPTKN